MAGARDVEIPVPISTTDPSSAPDIRSQMKRWMGDRDRGGDITYHADLT